MKVIKSKKVIALLATSLVAVIAAVGAYSYFTTSGSGSGSATVGTSHALTITQTGAAITGLVPNGPAQKIAYSIDNSGQGAQKLGAVSAAVSSIDQTPAGILAGSCTSDDFAFVAGAGVGTIAANGSYSSVDASEPTIQMIDSGSNQDGCQGATVHLTLSAAQGS